MRRLIVTALALAPLIPFPPFIVIRNVAQALANLIDRRIVQSAWSTKCLKASVQIEKFAESKFSLLP
jgi:hypothetical protein